MVAGRQRLRPPALPVRHPLDQQRQQPHHLQLPPRPQPDHHHHDRGDDINRPHYHFYDIDDNNVIYLDSYFDHVAACDDDHCARDDKFYVIPVDDVPVNDVTRHHYADYYVAKPFNADPDWADHVERELDQRPCTNDDCAREHIYVFRPGDQR